MSPVISSWYQPAHWPVVRQWLLLLLSSSLLISGLALWLFPRWQQYQQLLNDTQRLLQQIAALPSGPLSPPIPPPIVVTPAAPMAALVLLLKQISQLAEQQNLSLLALQQPSVAYQGAPLSTTTLTVELLGSYQALLDFLKALRNTRHPLAIDTLNLQREEQTGEVQLTLGLSLAKPREAP